MLAAEHRDLCLIVHSVVINEGQTAVIYDALTGDAPLPIIVFIERALHISLSVRAACHGRVLLEASGLVPEIGFQHPPDRRKLFFIQFPGASLQDFLWLSSPGPAEQPVA